MDPDPDPNPDKKLSSDIIFEILIRIKSLETLDTCKCVCKEWKRIIYESNFMPLCCKRRNIFSGYVMQDKEDDIYTCKFISIDRSEEDERGYCSIGNLPENMWILASCKQGLLCCFREMEEHYIYRYYVGKPATEQWQALPNPKIRFPNISHAIRVLSSSPLRYKIVRLSWSNDNYRIRCEIFDSKVWKWRETPGIQLPGGIIMYSRPAISIGNFIFWITTKDYIVAFHETTESFYHFPLPVSVRSRDYNFMQLIDYQGMLGLTCLAKDRNLELWLVEAMRDLNGRWIKKMVVDLKGLEESILKNTRFAGFYNAEIIYIMSRDKFIFYKLRDCSFCYVELPRELWTVGEHFEFRSDFEPVNLRGDIVR